MIRSTEVTLPSASQTLSWVTPARTAESWIDLGEIGIDPHQVGVVDQHPRHVERKFDDPAGVDGHFQAFGGAADLELDAGGAGWLLRRERGAAASESKPIAAARASEALCDEIDIRVLPCVLG